MPRFALKDLFLATTLIAVGMSLLYLLFSREPWRGWSAVVPYALAYGGSALIGAGILAPFKRPWIGAVVGVVVQVVIIELT